MSLKWFGVLAAFAGVAAATVCGSDTPPIWPPRFKLVQRKVPDNATLGNSTTVTYYDWERGANLILITPDADPGAVLWDLELNTHHSFYFYPSTNSCTPLTMPVGILRPDWLANATFLGPSIRNARRVLGWTKVDFIDYYADADTCEPVSWYFHEMKARFDTITYSPNVSIPDPAMFDPPAYCNSSLRA
eukprot:Hpha_TRINITY_DN16560_c3_g4::TRINITY_DN16560_c3_g4_i1::g.133726::m.133726